MTHVVAVKDYIYKICYLPIANLRVRSNQFTKKRTKKKNVQNNTWWKLRLGKLSSY